MPKREPLKFYRLWCGKKRYTHWMADELEVWRIAIEKGLAYPGITDRMAGLGPLTWIEEGTRKYARSRTVPVRRRGWRG